MQSIEPSQNASPGPMYVSAGVVDRALCASAGLVSLIVYLACLPPSVTGEDSGELVAAAYTLGIPHPPGYPLWTMLAHAATQFLPFGSVAWRAAAVSALFGALTVWLLAEMLLALFHRRGAAFTAALVFAFSREFWEQSVIAEVYTLGAFLVMLSLWLAVAWHRSRRRTTFYLAAFIGGLAGAHYTLNLLLLPALFAFVFACDLSPRRPRAYIVAALCTLPGWLMYLYLPIRSIANPAMDWGDPQTPARFWDVVSRGQYTHLLSAAPRTWDHFAQQSAVFGRFLAFEFTPWVGVLALPGIVGLWRRDRAIGAFLTAAFLLFGVGGILLPNFPMEYHWIWVNTPYWIPAYLLAAIFLGGAFAWMHREINWPKFAPAIAALVAIGSVAAWHGPHNYRRGDTMAANYASDLMDTFAPDAVYFGGGDHTVFPLLYLQIIEGRRPDVLIANRYGYPSAELYELAGESPPSTRPRDAEEDRLFAAALELDRPVYSATPRAGNGRARVNEGLLYRYVRANEAYTADPAWPEYRWPPSDALDTRGDWSNELVAHEYFAAQGRLQLDAGNTLVGADYLRLAASLLHGDKAALNNIGLALAERGLLGQAADQFGRALVSDPRFVPALLNLARCHIESGEGALAIPLLDRAEAAGADPERVAQMKRAASESLLGDERRADEN